MEHHNNLPRILSAIDQGITELSLYPYRNDRIRRPYPRISTEALATICDALSNNNTVTSLDLSSSCSRGINYSSAQNIANMFQSNKTIAKLCMRMCKTDDDGVLSIVKASMKQMSLTDLEIYQPRMTEEGIMELCHILPFTSIRHLSIGFTADIQCNLRDLGSTYSTYSNYHFMNLLLNPACQLASLNIMQNAWTDETVDLLIQVIEKGPEALQSLEIGYTKLKHSWVVNIFNALVSNTTLKLIDMSYFPGMSRKSVIHLENNELLGLMLQRRVALKKLLRYNRTLEVLCVEIHDWYTVLEQQPDELLTNRCLIVQYSHGSRCEEPTWFTSRNKRIQEIRKPGPWSTYNHTEFPPDIREQIFTTLVLARARKENGDFTYVNTWFPELPNELLDIIFGYIATP